MSEEELKKLKAAVEKWLPTAEWLMICGSLPPGVPAHFYCEVADMGRKAGVKTLLDTDGDALLHGLESKPTVVTPNQQEAERLLSRALITKTQFLEAAERIQSMGAQTVVLSLGGRGAIGMDGKQLYEAIPPRVDALCPIGAGDALAAAMYGPSARGRTSPIRSVGPWPPGPHRPFSPA